MRALVLAGGEGNRLRPITHTSAKQLVPVANKPILFYGLEQIREAGITEVGIIVGETEDEIRAAVGDGSGLGLAVTYIRQPEPLGLAHALLCGEDFLGDEDFVMFLGDNLVEGGISDLVSDFERARPAAQVLLKTVADPRRFGVAELDHDGNIRHLVEKPSAPPSDLALVGVYLFTPAIFDAARAIEPSERGELEITDAIQHLIDGGQTVRSSQIQGWWLDTGKKDDLLDANRVVLGTIERRIDGELDAGSEAVGAVIVAAGAELVDSTVRGPAIIGSGTRLIRTYVGPFTSIADDCVLEDTEIEHSVVLAGCRVSGIPRVEGSLLGRDVVIERAERKPSAYRFMVGDDSHIELPETS